MKLCGHQPPFGPDRPTSCAAPLRDGANPDRLRCFACGAWTAHGALATPDHVAMLAREAASLAGQLAADYQWAHSVSLDPTRRAQNGRSRTVSDPTGNSAADHRRAITAAYTTITARLLERAVRDLRAADEAIGEALLTAEPPGPKDHTKAAYHDTGGLRYPDPAVYAAQNQRRGRGEGVPT